MASSGWTVLHIMDFKAYFKLSLTVISNSLLLLLEYLRRCVLNILCDSPSSISSCNLLLKADFQLRVWVKLTPCLGAHVLPTPECPVLDPWLCFTKVHANLLISPSLHCDGTGRLQGLLQWKKGIYASEEWLWPGNSVLLSCGCQEISNNNCFMNKGRPFVMLATGQPLLGMLPSQLTSLSPQNRHPSPLCAVSGTT